MMQVGRRIAKLAVVGLGVAVVGAVPPLRAPVAASTELRALHLLAVGIGGAALFASYAMALRAVDGIADAKHQLRWRTHLRRFTLIAALLFWWRLPALARAAPGSRSG